MNIMIPRFVNRAIRPKIGSVVGLGSRLGAQTRFASKAFAGGSGGRAMPAQQTRATAPVNNLDATLTIRVGAFCQS